MVAAVGDLVLLLAADAVAFDESFGEQPHELAGADVDIGEGAEEAVDEGHVAVELALDPAGVEVAGDVGHGLDPAGDAERDLVEEDAPGQAVDRRAAEAQFSWKVVPGEELGTPANSAAVLARFGRARVLHHPAHAGVFHRGSDRPRSFRAAP